MDALEIQEKLDEVRVRLLEALAGLPDEALTEPGAIGAWSVADVLAHFVNWEAELVTGLNRIDQGRKPGRLLEALQDRQAYNASRYDDSKGRDLDRIFDDLQGVRVQIEDWLLEFSTKDLQEPGRVPGVKNKPLWKIIAEASFEHEASHLAQLEAYADRWKAEAENRISANDIEVSQNGNGN